MTQLSNESALNEIENSSLSVINGVNLEETMRVASTPGVSIACIKGNKKPPDARSGRSA